MRRNKHLLLWSSLGTLGLLIYAAYSETIVPEWRLHQEATRARLAPAEAEAFHVQLRQIVVPALHAIDRCTSCHVGMAPGEPGVAGDRLLGAHPKVVHDPGAFGCTVCHGGQGRATTAAAAHGRVPHWPEPMLSARYAYAGCGGCHTHLAVPSQAELTRGRDAFARNDCYACHRVDGRGGTLRPGGAGGMEGPDLSLAGAVGFAPDWYADHLGRRVAAAAGPWRTAFGELSAADRAALAVFLRSRVGAPGLVEAKALFHSLGCRGCHKVHGVGGDDGPDLTRVGQRDPGLLSFSGVDPRRGPRSLETWFAEHFRAPARVVPGSRMPALGLSEPQIDQLTLYMLSLRHSDRPQGHWPDDRIRSERFGERELADDGATLYGAFCAACHGPRGEGMRYPGMPAFPAVANPDFLAIASDAFITATVRHGRPGRRMPAWGEGGGGLRARDIDTVVAHLRSLGAGARFEADPRSPRWVQGDVAVGARLYAQACAACHGDAGQGHEGPALNNGVLLAHASDTYLVESIRRGRRGTSMPSFGVASPMRVTLAPVEIEAIVAFLRTWGPRS